MMEVINSIKGFNKDMTCTPPHTDIKFQYEEGKEYNESDAITCERGFHACERPLDVFGYYPPGTSVYHQVEQSGKIDRDNNKTASSHIKIGGKIDIVGIVKAQIEYTKSKTTTEYADPKMATAGNWGAATAGDWGAATAGNWGAATAGNWGAATAGDWGAATAGNWGAATAGDWGAATAGDWGAATSRGMSSSGENGISVARGNKVKVKGGLGAILVIAEEHTDNYNIKHWKAVEVDGIEIKEDTWYCLKNGELVECEENY